MQGARWVLALVAALVMVGCGGSDKKYYVPVDSPAKPFVAPEADELLEGEGDDWGADAADDDDDDDDGEEPEAKPEPPKTRAAPPRPTQPTPNTKPTTPKK